jgi:hypothetical protein
MIIDRKWKKFTWDNSCYFRVKGKKEEKQKRNRRKVFKIPTSLTLVLYFACFLSLTDAGPASKPNAPVPRTPAAPAPKPNAPVPRKPAAPAPKPNAPAPRKPSAPAPKPNAPAPRKPSAPAPKPNVPAPRKPTVPAPKPRVPAPKPAVPAPKPRVPVLKPAAPVPNTSFVGGKKMLMIPLKFSDHMERIVPATEHLTLIMNSDDFHKQLCPFGSVKNYFSVNSYGKLELDVTVVPWVAVSKTEAFYGNGSSGYNNYRSHLLIREALEALDATGFDFAPFDTDNDGYIDVGFFHSGYDGVFEKPDVYGTDHPYRIKSHIGSLSSLPGGKWTSSSGKSVTKYHISPSLRGVSGSEIVPIGTVVYQIARFFGIPSLDDHKSEGEGLGRFCLMGTGYLGWDGSSNRPSLMSAWPKIQAGWVVPTNITSTGTYTAGRACSVPDVFKVSKNFPEGEYLLIENRYPCSYDADLPGQGLAVYHIDESKLDNNDAGYPGQEGWPTNGKHYRVALLPGHGDYLLETKAMVTIDGNDWNYGQYLLGDQNDRIGPDGFYNYYPYTYSYGAYPNTNTYTNGAINSTCITITITTNQNSENMFFEVSFECAN